MPDGQQQNNRSTTTTTRADTAGFHLLGGVGTSKRLKILQAYPPTHLTPEKLAKKDTYPPP